VSQAEGTRPQTSLWALLPWDERVALLLRTTLGCDEEPVLTGVGLQQSVWGVKPIEQQRHIALHRHRPDHLCGHMRALRQPPDERKRGMIISLNGGEWRHIQPRDQNVLNPDTHSRRQAVDPRGERFLGQRLGP